MKNTKKILSGLIIGVVTVTILTGCAQSQVNSNESFTNFSTNTYQSEKQLDFYKTLSNKGDIRASNCLGFYYSSKDGDYDFFHYKCDNLNMKLNKQNYKKAEYYFQKGADKNDVKSMIYLGHLYHHEHKLTKALNVLKKAAKLGSIQATDDLIVYVYISNNYSNASILPYCNLLKSTYKRVLNKQEGKNFNFDLSLIKSMYLKFSNTCGF